VSVQRAFSGRLRGSCFIIKKQVMNISADAEFYSPSDPLTLPKLERIYHRVVLKQDFYGRFSGL